MGILNPSDTCEIKVEKQFERIFAEEEKVVISYKQIRDLIILTNLRLIIIDKKGVTGRKKVVKSYPLNKICYFEIENSPYFDIDNEVIIAFTGIKDPLSFTLSKGTDVYEFSRLLTTYAFR